MAKVPLPAELHQLALRVRDQFAEEGAENVCVMASMVFAEAARARGFQARLRRGYVLTPEFVTWHVWAECDGVAVDVGQAVAAKQAGRPTGFPITASDFSSALAAENRRTMGQMLKRWDSIEKLDYGGYLRGAPLGTWHALGRIRKALAAANRRSDAAKKAARTRAEWQTARYGTTVTAVHSPEELALFCPQAATALARGVAPGEICEYALIHEGSTKNSQRAMALVDGGACRHTAVSHAEQSSAGHDGYRIYTKCWGPAQPEPRMADVHTELQLASALV